MTTPRSDTHNIIRVFIRSSWMHDISALGEQKIAIGTPHMASALETEARQSLTGPLHPRLRYERLPLHCSGGRGESSCDVRSFQFQPTLLRRS